MSDIKRVKVVVTGYYDINMDFAMRDYGTDNPDEMLVIDKDAVIPAIALDQLAAEDISIELSWEN